MDARSTSDPHLWGCLVSIAKAHAYRHRSIHGDAEDCAMAFAYRMVVYLQGHAGTSDICTSDKCTPDKCKIGMRSAAWMNRCAENFAKNFVRTKVRLRSKEIPWQGLTYS